MTRSRILVAADFRRAVDPVPDLPELYRAAEGRVDLPRDGSGAEAHAPVQAPVRARGQGPAPASGASRVPDPGQGARPPARAGGGARVGPLARGLRARLGPFLADYGLLIAFFAAWQVGSSTGWLNPAVFPPLDRVAAALWGGIASGALLGDIAISLQRAGSAFLAAVAVGIPLGLFMGQMRGVERALDPILQLFRQTSALALYPVFILMLGLGEASKVFVIFWATLFPVLLATIGGVKEVDPKLIEMARSFGATRGAWFRRVVLPAALPSVFVGLRLSATTALLLLIAAEMIGANRGIGFQVINAQYNFQIPLMFAAIFLLAGLGLAVNGALVVLQRRLCRWSLPGG